MENASKALIIAGAILISIVLVSVGVIVVNSLNPDDAVSTMSQQEVQAFNSKFDSYTGNAKTGTTIKQLMTIINTNNINYNGDASKTIKVELDSNVGIAVSGEQTDSTSLTTIRNGLNSGARYNVTPRYNGVSGLLEKITIEKVS